jgi:hypothetical protein
MSPRHCIAVALLAQLAGAALPALADARGLSVEVWTGRGRDAVYRPGESLELEARVSDDAHLLVYEIDSEGYLHLLHPEPGRSGFVAGGETHVLPESDSESEWVVQEPVGQGYVVAIASVEPFRDLPWYLRPHDRNADHVGYHDREADDEEGVTAEGRIVGDPFVAMEKVRRRVVDEDDDPESFATAYTAYYVHQEVRYPRYLCYDCHRPGRWSWWDGFDPYYASCSVFDVRVNWHWAWGPSYWFGRVPYFVYVYRPTCPPDHRHAYDRGDHYSSWDGWRRWNGLWGSKTIRYKTDPPSAYVPPSDDGARHPRAGGPGRHERGERRTPPGLVDPPGSEPQVTARAPRGGDGDAGRSGRTGLARRGDRSTEPMDRDVVRAGRPRDDRTTGRGRDRREDDAVRQPRAERPREVRRGDDRVRRWDDPRARSTRETRRTVRTGREPWVDRREARESRREVRWERPAPRETRREVRVERPAPRESRREVRLERQAPRESRREPRVERQAPREHREVRVERQAPRGGADRREGGSPGGGRGHKR